MSPRSFAIRLLFLLCAAASGTVASYGMEQVTAMADTDMAQHEVRDSIRTARGIERDSIRAEYREQKTRNPYFIALKTSGGTIFPTNDFNKGDYRIPFYKAAAFKFAVSSLGNRWEDIAYGMPYYGIGIYAADFGSRERRRNLGRPYSIFMFQGATLAGMGRNVRLNYEWNVGASGGWKAYDPFTNPDNVAIGSDVNVHVGLALYLNFAMASGFDIRLGGDLTHFSNGASKLPNAGVNAGSVFVEAVYNINHKYVKREYNPRLMPPEYDDHFVSEILVNISSRQVAIDTTGTSMPSPYIDRKFTVLGLNYSVMRAPTYRYRYGLSLDLLYDESSGVHVVKSYNPADGRFYDQVVRGSVGERFSLGVSAKGEVVLPAYSIFANIGWQVIHGNKNDKRLYQIIGAKIYLKDNFFGTFGIRANHFSKAQFLFWSFGYTIDHTPVTRRAGRSGN